MNPRKHPDERDALRVLAIVFLLMAGVGRLSIHAWLPQLLFEAGLLLVPLLYAGLAKLGPFAANGFRSISWRQAALVMTASLGSLWLLKGMADLQMDLFSWLGLETEREMQQINTQVSRARDRGRLFAAAMLGLAPAICEETFFRGIVFRGMARSFSPGRALLYTSLLFSAMHGKLIQAGLMIFLGLYFGLVVWLTGSLWAGMLAHAMNNLAVVGVTYLVPGGADHLRAPFWMLAISGTVFVLALMLLNLESRRLLNKEGFP